MSQTLTPLEKKRRAALYARLTYAGVMLVFITICAVAVVMTMQKESNKSSFRAIKVSKPIYFIDYTYVDKTEQPAGEKH